MKKNVTLNLKPISALWSYSKPKVLLLAGKVLNINSLAMQGERREKLTYPYGRMSAGKLTFSRQQFSTFALLGHKVTAQKTFIVLCLILT